VGKCHGRQSRFAGDDTGGLGPPARLRPVGDYAPEGRAYASERNVAYGGNVSSPHNRKGGSGNPPPKGRRAPALSRPPFSRAVKQFLHGRPTLCYHHNN